MQLATVHEGKCRLTGRACCDARFLVLGPLTVMMWVMMS